MPTKENPHYYLDPGTLAGPYLIALREAGHGEVKGWHCPVGNDVCVEMKDGKHFSVKVGPGNHLVIASLD